MQDNVYSIGNEVWFYETASINSDGNQRLFNGYILDWRMTAGSNGYIYTLLLSRGNTVEKNESELFPQRDTAANKMSGVLDKIDPSLQAIG